MIKHFIRGAIRFARKTLLGPRLAPLADLSHGEILNLMEVAAEGMSSTPNETRMQITSAPPDLQEIHTLRELCAQLSERVQVLERIQ